MQTEDLIDVLAESLTPVSGQARNVRLAIGVAVGSGVAFLILLGWVGLRPDLAAAIASGGFWMKLTFPIAVALASFTVVERLSRPGTLARPAWMFVALPVLVIASLAAIQILETPDAKRTAIWLGNSARECPVLIVALSAPIFCGLIWSFRHLAPTRLTLTGFGVGLLAGAASASVYALACRETSIAFVATWYTLGILGSCALGALAGPRFLRW
jgi:hypothetical protein